MKQRWLVLLLAATLPTLACDGGQEADAETMPEPAESQMAALPDTTAQAVWDYIQAMDYQDWEMWPGKGEQYQGTEPHGALLTTYLNETAKDALVNGSGPLPAGSIVIKDNFMPDGNLAAVTVMYSAEGYNPDANDYFWAKYQADGSVAAAGRVGTCTGCHSAGERGYLRTDYDGGM